MPSTDVACVIPTHSRAALLREALASVAAQELVPVEVVVVSDVVDDEARRACAEAAAAGLPVAYHEFVDGVGGASASRNRGAAASTAPLVAFLDDDDWWDPSYLRRAVAALTAQGADVAATWLRLASGTAEGEQVDGTAIAPGLSAQEVVAMNRGTTGSNLVVSRAALERIGGFDEGLRYKNDTDLFYRLLAAGFRYAVVPDRLVFQRLHAHGQLTDFSERRAQAQEQYMRKHRAALRLRDRREIRMWVHYTRAHTARSPLARLGHWIATAWNAPLDKWLQLGSLFSRRRFTRAARTPAAGSGTGRA